MLKVLAIVAVLSAAAVPAAMSKPPQGTPAANHGCDKSYTYKAAKRGLKKALKHHYPMTRALGARGWKYVRCVRVRQHVQWLTGQRKKLRSWRRSYEHLWQIRFHALSAYEQSWAESTSKCETRAYWPNKALQAAANTGNGFLGAFQFMQSTWNMAGQSGSPTAHSWWYQAVVAVHWKWQTSDEQWPVCGD